MIGLIKKDFFNVASSLKVYLMIPLMFAFVSYANESMDLLAFSTCFVGIFIVMSCFAYDDMAHFDAFALTLPISRKDLVLSKFLIGNLFLIIVFIVSNLLAFLLAAIFEGRFENYSVLNFLEYTFLATMIVNMITGFVSCIMFKYGSEKGRVVFLVIFISIGFAGGLAGSLFDGLDLDALFHFLDQYLTILALPLSLVVESICIFVSTKVMEKKEI